MAWKIDYAPIAEKQLDGLDASARARILKTLRRDLARHGDPRAFGAALVGRFVGLWKYRVGDYRAVARIEDARVVVVIIQVGHRSDIYR